MEWEKSWKCIMLEVKFIRPLKYCIKLGVYIPVCFTHWIRLQLTLQQKLKFIMEMKELCMHMYLIISSKFNTMVMTTVRIIISKTTPPVN